MIAMSELAAAGCFDRAVWFEEHSTDSRRCLPVISGLADCVPHHLDRTLHEFAWTELEGLRVRLHFRCLLSGVVAVEFLRVSMVVDGMLLIITVVAIVFLVICLLVIVIMLMAVLLQRTPPSALR